MEKINKGKITLEEHKELGKFLRIAQDKLAGEISNLKPKTYARKSHQNKAFKLISELKNHLEEVMFKDYPNITSEEGLNIYYGSAGRTA